MRFSGFFVNAAHEPAHGQQSVLQDLEFIVAVAVHDGASRCPNRAATTVELDHLSDGGMTVRP